MMQHYAHISTSPRLQRTLKVLQEANGEISNYELAFKAKIVAVSTAISELRYNDFDITCEQRHEKGQRRFYYNLIKEPTNGAY